MKTALVVVGLVVAGLAALGLRVVLEGRDALARGDDAMAQGRVTDAIAAWESSARWYLPAAPHVDAAYGRLLELARAGGAEAVPAWRAVRRAALATRSLWTPHAGDLAQANAALARAAAHDPDGARAAGADPAARRAWHQARLDRVDRPGHAAAALAIVGILSWLAGIGVIVRRGIDDAGHLVRRPAAIGTAVTLLGIVGWATGLYNA